MGRNMLDEDEEQPIGRGVPLAEAQCPECYRWFFFAPDVHAPQPRHTDALSIVPRGQPGFGLKWRTMMKLRMCALTLAIAAAIVVLTGHPRADDLIKTDAITARTIAANAITTAKLDANAVTSDKIAANTITAADIAAGTITTTEIAANTITAADIAANTITADRLNVSTLSAISADLGTVTAGEIDGVTIKAGSGDEVILNSSGITLTAGTSTNNKVKWSDGSYVQSSGDLALLHGDTQAILEAGSFSAFVSASTGAFGPGGAGSNLGASGVGAWAEFFFTPTTTTSSLNPLVINGNQALEKTDGFDGSCGGSVVESLTIERGIVTGCSGSEPSANHEAQRIAALERQVQQLRRENGEMRRMIADLVAVRHMVAELVARQR